MNLAPGNVVDSRYEILSILGEGGMGTVYKARETGLERIVALKLLHLTQVSNPEEFERFRREGKVLSTIDHPNILKCYRFGIWHSIPYIAMEYVEGQPLCKMIGTDSLAQLSVNNILDIVIQICRAMEYAHEHRIVHRDLKPANVLILQDDENYVVKVADFGLARILSNQCEKSQHLTHTGALVGSVYYMSPEQCLGQKATESSDIYSLGCLLYECLTGAPPFVADTPIGLMNLHVNEKPISPSAALGKNTTVQLPTGMDEVVLKALEKNSSNRHPGMKEYGTALEAIRDGRGQEWLDTTWTSKATVSSRPPLTSSATAISVLAVLSVIAMVLATVYGFNAYTGSSLEGKYTQDMRLSLSNKRLKKWQADHKKGDPVPAWVFACHADLIDHLIAKVERRTIAKSLLSEWIQDALAQSVEGFAYCSTFNDTNRAVHQLIKLVMVAPGLKKQDCPAAAYLAAAISRLDPGRWNDITYMVEKELLSADPRLSVAVLDELIVLKDAGIATPTNKQLYLLKLKALQSIPDCKGETLLFAYLNVCDVEPALEKTYLPRIEKMVNSIVCSQEHRVRICIRLAQHLQGCSRVRETEKLLEEVQKSKCKLLPSEEVHFLTLCARVSSEFKRTTEAMQYYRRALELANSKLSLDRGFQVTAEAMRVCAATKSERFTAIRPLFELEMEHVMNAPDAVSGKADSPAVAAQIIFDLGRNMNALARSCNQRGYGYKLLDKCSGFLAKQRDKRPYMVLRAIQVSDARQDHAYELANRYSRDIAKCLSQTPECSRMRTSKKDMEEGWIDLQYQVLVGKALCFGGFRDQAEKIFVETMAECSRVGLNDISPATYPLLQLLEEEREFLKAAKILERESTKITRAPAKAKILLAMCHEYAGAGDYFKVKKGLADLQPMISAMATWSTVDAAYVYAGAARLHVLIGQKELARSEFEHAIELYSNLKQPREVTLLTEEVSKL